VKQSGFCLVTCFLSTVFIFSSCQTEPSLAENNSLPPVPTKIIDLSSTITEDLPVRIWGHRFLSDLGFRDTNEFEYVINEEPLYSSNSYWTLFNHGGAHLDAPNHMEKGATPIDEIRLEELIGPARLLDFRSSPLDEAIPLEEIQRTGIQAGEIAMLMVGYIPPSGDDELPSYPYLSQEATEYLETLPVKAFATDAFSVENVARMYEAMAEGVTGYEGVAPLHRTFLTREIPLFESLENLEELVGVNNFVFVGFPLKVKGSDGSPIRAAALIY
jgi:arylformamidase